MSTKLAGVFICLLHLIFFADAARILAMYPVASISHQIAFRPITLELVKRGHEVVVITPDPMFPKGGKEKPPKNLTEIDVHDISYNAWKIFMQSAKGNKENIIAQTEVGLAAIFNMMDKQLESEEVKEIIKGKQNFDILLLEACVRQTLGLSHIYKVPVIQISSFGAVFGNYDVMGAPTHPLLYPSLMNQKLYNLTMYDKFYQLKTNYMLGKVLSTGVAADEERLLKKHFGSNVPSIEELTNNVDMLFLNMHPIWEGNRPVPPSVIHLGGLPQKPNKELPTDLKSYLDSSKHGVIYISFGTNVQPSLLPADKIQVLISTFSKLPYDVLWKWDKDVLPGKSDNIRISKWLPQSDLLKHPKVKLFVTQGGLQSTDEAITAGVPLIGVPMLVDQWYNVEKYLHHGIGLKLELKELSEELFAHTVNTVITDPSFRNNIVKLRTLMLDQPQTPLDRAIWWIEYVLRHGGAKHLRSPAANISWSQYLELELVAIVLSALFLLFLVFIVLLYSLYKFVLCKFIIKTKVKKN